MATFGGLCLTFENREGVFFVQITCSEGHIEYVLIAVGAITIILSMIGCLGLFTVRTQWGEIIYKLHLKQ